MNKVILDASAILALLNQEPGHEQVEKVLENALVSTVNFSEVITVLIEAGLSLLEAEEITSGILNEIIPFDQQQALVAASLRKLTKQNGLSFGDRACIALGKQYGLQIFTADKVWNKIKLDGVKIQVIR